jgi:hypothetical protein
MVQRTIVSLLGPFIAAPVISQSMGEGELPSCKGLFIMCTKSLGAPPKAAPGIAIIF